MTKDEAYKEEEESRTKVRVYSDGSDINGGVGAAAILFRDGIRQKTLRAYLGTSEHHTVYEAELVGIMLAAHLLHNEVSLTQADIGVDTLAP